VRKEEEQPVGGPSNSVTLFFFGTARARALAECRRQAHKQSCCNLKPWTVDKGQSKEERTAASLVSVHNIHSTYHYSKPCFLIRTTTTSCEIIMVGFRNAADFLEEIQSLRRASPLEKHVGERKPRHQIYFEPLSCCPWRVQKAYSFRSI